MARLAQQDRRQARSQARAETLPQIKGKRRSLHSQVAALRSEEDPLQQGLAAAEAAIRRSGLSPTDKALALKDFAERQADIPASITSQIGSAREQTGGEIADLQSAQAAQSASILQSLLTAQAEHRQSVADEVAAEGRQSQNAIQQAELEKKLGLGDYSKTPAERAIEEADVGKIEAETAKAQREAHGNGLTPYENLKTQERHAEDHDTARLHAKLAFEAAKAELGDPHSWDAPTWAKIAALVEEKGKVPTAAAETAVGAIRNHFEPHGGNGAFNFLNAAAHSAASALSRQAPTPTSSATGQSLQPLGTGSSALLSLLKSGRY